MAHDVMHRTRISLGKWQYQYVVGRARRTQSSISDVVRRLVTQAAGSDMPAERASDPIFSIIGMAEGDGALAGREHDSYLYHVKE